MRQLAIPNFAKTMTDVAMPEAPAYDVDVRGANMARNKAVFLRRGGRAEAEAGRDKEKGPRPRRAGRSEVDNPEYGQPTALRRGR